MSIPTKATNPELFCAYEHCQSQLPESRRMHNYLVESGGSFKLPAKYCSRQHKEAAAQQRRAAARRANKIAGFQA